MLIGIYPYAPLITPTQFGSCNMGHYSETKNHFQLGKQTVCKNAEDSQLCSDNLELSWSVLRQLKIQCSWRWGLVNKGIQVGCLLRNSIAKSVRLIACSETLLSGPVLHWAVDWVTGWWRFCFTMQKGSDAEAILHKKHLSI